MGGRGIPLEPGTVVQSLKGHDAGGWFAVVKADGKSVWLCDGRLRPLEKPKRKSARHIRKTNTRLDLTSGVTTNKKLREALRALRGNEGGISLV